MKQYWWVIWALSSCLGMCLGNYLAVAPAKQAATASDTIDYVKEMEYSVQGGRIPGDDTVAGINIEVDSFPVKLIRGQIDSCIGIIPGPVVHDTIFIYK